MIVVPVGKGRDTRNLSLSLHKCIRKILCEDSVRSWLSVSQEEGSHQKPNMPTP